MTIETTDQHPHKTPRRIYRVNDTLIKAATQAQAVHHYVKRTVSVRVATQDDIVQLRDLGFEVQEAGKEWIESPKPTKRVEIVADVFVDPGAAKAMAHAAEAAASVPGATAEDIEGAAMAAVHVVAEGRTGIRFELVDEPNELTASSDPAVLGSEDPSVLSTDESPENESP